MGNSSERRELLFTKLEDVFGPAEKLSPYSLKDKWRVVPYEAEERIGNILASIGGTPEDISFDPRLTGWYKICIGLLRDCVTTLKLTSDTAFFTVASSPVSSGAGRRVEEALWRYADMTDESIPVTKKYPDEPYSSCLASIRFVPLSDEDVAEYKKELARRDTKRIYATDDMHNRFYFLNLEKMEGWDPVVLKYIGSDVEWISMEELRSLTSGKCPVDDLDLVDFARAGDKRVQKQLGKFNYGEILRHLVELGHKHNFKMSISLRMGAWRIGYPSDQCYFDSAFEAQHPEYKCVDRNGDVMSAMSYAFPEVQDYLVDTIVNMARSGCDAVTLYSTSRNTVSAVREADRRPIL